MAKASDNLFPKLLLVEGAAPSSPAAGNQGLFIDSADHKLKRINSSGTVTTVEGGSGGSAGETTWTAPSLLNGWVNYGTGADYCLAGFRKDSNGVVHIRGLIKNGTSGSMFVLPAGYRPVATQSFAVCAPGYTNGVGTIGVDPNGTVRGINYSAGGTYLDGITFYTD